MYAISVISKPMLHVINTVAEEFKNKILRMSICAIKIENRKTIIGNNNNGILVTELNKIYPSKTILNPIELMMNNCVEHLISVR